MSIIKSLALDSTGDLLIEHNALQMVDGKELLRQKVQEVINTNKGEWFLDWEQGINLSALTGKGVTEETVRSEIAEGLRQVDENLVISDFRIEKVDRTLIVTFTASNEKTKTGISVSTEF